MQTNFQQFVSSNQGKLITFLHNDKPVSKVVSDIQGEYFTGKTNVSDAKIDDLYYFSDCKMIDEDRPLEDVLSSNKDVTIETTSRLFQNFNFHSIEGNINIGNIIIGTSNGVPTGIKSKNVKRVLSKDGKELYVNIACDSKEDL